MNFEILEKIEEIKDVSRREDIKFLDLKSMDLFGRIRHLSLPIEMFSEKLVSDGIGVDGSNYGFSSTENSDFVMVLDLDNYFIEDFKGEKRISFFVNFKKSPDSEEFIEQDIRWICKKCQTFIKELKIGEEVLLSPEYEFYIFKDVYYKVSKEESVIKISSEEEGLLTSYHLDSIGDIFSHIRDEITLLLEKLGVKVKYHHHEVGQWGQQEIELGFLNLMKAADISLLVKYISRLICEKYDLRVTFMPKPVSGMAGNGWHVHQFIKDGEKSLFFEEGSLLSKLGMNYVGGLIRHAKSLCAFTNPTVNSYKRLTPGYEAPVSIDFGEGNRSSLIRIPQYAKNEKECRIEYRVPDFSCNPYLALSAMVMAGIDGITKELDPFEEVEILRQKGEDKLPLTLEESLHFMEKDHEFLLKGNVFPEDLIHNWITLKKRELGIINSYISPIEFELFFDL